MKFLGRLLLALALLPALSFANSVAFSNSGGSLVGTSGGLTADSTVISIQSGALLDTGVLGTVSFATGALASGSLESGGSFAAGGLFTITGNGADGTHSGVIFNGTFSGPVTWTLVTLANGTHNYTLTGALSGTWFSGQSVTGASIQLTINTGTALFNGSTQIASGDTDISGIGLRVANTPEPGTLALLGTGLAGIGGLLRRKMKCASI